MNPLPPDDSREALEARITALILGELSSPDARELEARIAADPELVALRKRLQQAADLIREASAPGEAAAEPAAHPVKLSSARRETLLASFKTVRPASFVPKPKRATSWLVPAAVAACLITLAGALLLPALNRAKTRSAAVTTLDFAPANAVSELADERSAKLSRRELRELNGPLPPASEEVATMKRFAQGTVLAVQDAAGKPASVEAPAEKAFTELAGRRVVPTSPTVALYDDFGAVPAQKDVGQVIAGNVVATSAAGVPAPPPPAAIPAPALRETEGLARKYAGSAVVTEERLAERGAKTSRVAETPVPVLGDKPVLGYAVNLRGFDEDASAMTHSAVVPEKQPQIQAGRQDWFAAAAQDKAKAQSTDYYFSRPAGGINGGAATGLPLATEREVPELAQALKSSEKALHAEDYSKALADANWALRMRSTSAATRAPQLGRRSPADDQKVASVAESLTLDRADRDVPAVSAAQPALVAAATATAGSLYVTNAVELRKKEADARPARPAGPAPVPQPEFATLENPFSTFSLNVSDVSFRLTTTALENGQMPDPSTVRTEEFINAFDYRDPAPTPGAPIALAWDRARYPFAQNRDLLRISVKTGGAGREAGRSLNLVLLLDNSGSMERSDRVQIIAEALRVLGSKLQPQDKLTIITFSRTPTLRADGVSGAQAVRTLTELMGLTPEGGTNLEEALRAAYAAALRHYSPSGLNRVVLLTDGAANLGDIEPDRLRSMVEQHRKAGIALDCFGIGFEGYDDQMLEALSRNGDGRYAFINTPEAAATEFADKLAGALQIAASDVKVQVEFNPARVTLYRQLGYAKHQLTKEQFRDNTVDAAEIAALESGNALYLVEVKPEGTGALGIVRVRYKVPGTTSINEYEWALPYTGAAPALAQSPPALRLAGAAAGFAEWLAGSPWAAEVTTGKLLSLLEGVPQQYSPDVRPARLVSAIRQANSIGGK